MKRWSKEFVDPYLTKMLFISLVLPNLEYGSIIWNPCYLVLINSTVSVQKHFFCLQGLGYNSYDLPPHQSRLALIKLPTLKMMNNFWQNYPDLLVKYHRDSPDENIHASRIENESCCIMRRSKRCFLDYSSEQFLHSKGLTTQYSVIIPVRN